MAIEFIGAVKLFFSPLTKGAAWFYRKARLMLFRLRSRKPPFDESTAKGIAFGILGGTIERAISYRNMDSKHYFISVIRRSNDEALDNQIHVLKQAGSTYRKVWSSEFVYGVDYGAGFEVADIDGDGVQETLFVQTSFGTGAGEKTLTAYSPSRRKQFEVVESYNWQDATSPVSPEVEIRGDDDKAFLKAFICHGTRRGFLQSSGPIDLDRVEFAIQRWHKENGAKENGVVKVHLYKGMPECKASVVLEVDTPEIRWIAYFKAPLYGYLKSSKEHFIAYSPAWVYNWVTCMVFDGRRLWFGIHVGEGLFSFDYESKALARYLLFKGRPLPEVNQIRFDGKAVVLNGKIRIPSSEVGDLSVREMKTPEEIRRTGRIN